MHKPKLIRITTVPLSLEKLLEGQLAFMNTYFDVTAVSADENRLKAYSENEGVAFFPLSLTRKITPLVDLIALLKLYLFLVREKPQIVHTHTPKAGIVGMLAAWLARVPHRLHTVAGLPLMEATGFKRKILIFIEKLTYRFATKIYPNSYGLKEFILQGKFTSMQKLSIICNGSSNGIDTTYFSKESYNDDFQKDLKKKLQIPEDDFVFIFVGRLVRDKGIIELVDAFTSLYLQNVSLLLVGPTEQELDPLPEKTLLTIQNSEKIISTGFQLDVRPYFAISDALVFPSYREGFPNVVLQALSMELPAIVSDINGCNEIVAQNFNGLIIPKKNTDLLAKAMLSLFNDPKKYQKLKENTRISIVEKYERNFLWEALLKEYQNLINLKS
ncbi:MAG: glycosyltransferase family 4 protein [Flavobacteriaceae bacterium]